MASPTSSTLPFVESSGARLAIFADGVTDDITVLLHGGPGVPDYPADVSAILATKHRAVRFDQRGTGQSTCHSGQYALDNYVEDLDAVRCAYRLERLNLFGHSWGATVARLCATRHPDRVAQLTRLGEDLLVLWLPP